ncbi:MAG: ATP-binding protein [Anaerolineae bacterium]|jgi:DNA replication protein DnaC
MSDGVPIRTIAPGLLDEDSGLPDDGLPPCDLCHGLRRVKADVGPAHPLFAQFIPCPRCRGAVKRQQLERRFRERRRRIERYSQLVGRARRQTFSNFELRRDEEHTELVREAFRAARAFAGEPEGWLFLYGSRGTGKSHLAAAIANHLLAPSGAEQKSLVLFMTVPGLLNLLRSGFERGDHENLLALTKEVDVLILDDLGVERVNDWVRETLYEVTHARWQTESPLVVVSNLRPEGLEPRLRDRLMDDDLTTVVKVAAPTYRQRKRNPGLVL